MDFVKVTGALMYFKHLIDAASATAGPGREEAVLICLLLLIFFTLIWETKPG